MQKLTITLEGPSGSGKTLVAKAIAGLVGPALISMNDAAGSGKTVIEVDGLHGIDGEVLHALVRASESGP